jgi:hypothetical protein
MMRKFANRVPLLPHPFGPPFLRLLCLSTDMIAIPLFAAEANLCLQCSLCKSREGGPWFKETVHRKVYTMADARELLMVVE